MVSRIRLSGVGLDMRSSDSVHPVHSEKFSQTTMGLVPVRARATEAMPVGPRPMVTATAEQNFRKERRDTPGGQGMFLAEGASCDFILLLACKPVACCGRSGCGGFRSPPGLGFGAQIPAVPGWSARGRINVLTKYYLEIRCL